MLMRLDESGITVKLYGPDDALLDIKPNKPRVYVSLGMGVEKFITLYDLPLHERKRWLHYTVCSEIQPSKLFFCWFKMYRSPA